MFFSSYTNVALLAAKVGAKILLKYYNKKLYIEYKNLKGDPVTQADKISQKAIIKTIKNVFPMHNILAEEKNTKKTVDRYNEYCWIIDPLDGTINFIHGLPIFCVSIGLKYKNEIISSVIYSPIMKELFVAEKNKGAWLNGKRIKVSDTKNTIQALAVTGFSFSIKNTVKSTKTVKIISDMLSEIQGIRYLGSAALNMAYIACGRFDFFFEEGLKPWDVAAAILTVTEAGGKISDYKGLDHSIFKNTIVASNNIIIHKKILNIIHNVKK
ncbi:MAG: inositol monophosphatase [Endomicrobium sp.]|jgi:myo-inositol-1(or 4)-monophosphatase|nr:inositol monophosphatase [Endomicrobium sp.]